MGCLVEEKAGVEYQQDVRVEEYLVKEYLMENYLMVEVEEKARVKDYLVEAVERALTNAISYTDGCIMEGAVIYLWRVVRRLWATNHGS